MDFKEIFGSNRPRCQHFDEDGTRCKGDPQTNKKFCFMHDPNQKEKQTEARRKGGEVRAQLYPRKIPPDFHYQPPTDHAQIEALLDQLAIYYTQDEIDLRSARFYCYIAIGKLALWNSLDRRQYRAVRSAENQARIMRREKDPWSPQYGALARAAKAKEEAEKAANPEANPTGQSDPSAMPSDVALSFRELEELRQEAERKEQERTRVRHRLSHWNESEDQNENRNQNQNEETEPRPTILGALKKSFSQMSRANRARDRERAQQAQETESSDPTVSKNARESAPPKRPPQPVPPAPASRGAGRGSAQNEARQTEQQQQRMYQSDMNELTERLAEEVRAEAYKKGEWRRKRKW